MHEPGSSWELGSCKFAPCRLPRPPNLNSQVPTVRALVVARQRSAAAAVTVYIQHAGPQVATRPYCPYPCLNCQVRLHLLLAASTLGTELASCDNGEISVMIVSEPLSCFAGRVKTAQTPTPEPGHCYNCNPPSPIHPASTRTLLMFTASARYNPWCIAWSRTRARQRCFTPVATSSPPGLCVTCTKIKIPRQEHAYSRGRARG